MGLTSTVLPTGTSDCELVREGLLAQPVNAISSLAFVAVGVAIAVLASRRKDGRLRSMLFAAGLAATGLGSGAYHGPQPPGAELMHDLPIVFVLALMAVHDVSLVAPRFRGGVPVLAAIVASLCVGAVLAPVADSLAFGVPAAIVIGAEVLVYQRGLRPRSKAQQRRVLLVMAIAVFVAGGLYWFGRTGSAACDPTSLLQPHAGWHVAASCVFAIWWWLALAEHPRQSVGRGSVRSLPLTSPHP